MADDPLPSLNEWLADLRSRPAPHEVPLRYVALSSPIPRGAASQIVALKIVRYDEPRNPVPTRGVYLFALDETGVEVSDTWHEHVDDAFAQAEAEFGVTPDAWRDLASSD